MNTPSGTVPALRPAAGTSSLGISDGIWIKSTSLFDDLNLQPQCISPPREYPSC